MGVLLPSPAEYSSLSSINMQSSISFTLCVAFIGLVGAISLQKRSDGSTVELSNNENTGEVEGVETPNSREKRFIPLKKVLKKLKLKKKEGKKYDDGGSSGNCRIVEEHQQRPNCRTVYHDQCDTVDQEKCSTHHEEECVEEFQERCRVVQEKECHVEEVEQCSTEYSKQCDQTFEKQCSNKPVCHEEIEQSCQNERVCSRVLSTSSASSSSASSGSSSASSGKGKFGSSGKGKFGSSGKGKFGSSEKGKFVHFSAGVGKYKRSVDDHVRRQTKTVVSSRHHDGTEHGLPQAVQAEVATSGVVNTKRTTRSIVSSTSDGELETVVVNEADESTNTREKRSLFTAKKIIAKVAKKFVKKEKLYKKAGDDGSSGGAQDCSTQVVCNDVPVRKCRSEQSCVDVPKEVCRSIPNKVCHTNQVEKCHKVPRKECEQVPRQKCRKVPRKVCNLVPTKQCRKVASEECSNDTVVVQKEVCTSTVASSSSGYSSSGNSGSSSGYSSSGNSGSSS